MIVKCYYGKIVRDREGSTAENAQYWSVSLCRKERDSAIRNHGTHQPKPMNSNLNRSTNESISAARDGVHCSLYGSLQKILKGEAVWFFSVHVEKCPSRRYYRPGWVRMCWTRSDTPISDEVQDVELRCLSITLKYYIYYWDIFDNRARSTVHDWVLEADRQPEGRYSADPVAADETLIRLDNEQHWLYAGGITETN